MLFVFRATQSLGTFSILFITSGATDPTWSIMPVQGCSVACERSVLAPCSGSCETESCNNSAFLFVTLAIYNWSERAAGTLKAAFLLGTVFCLRWRAGQWVHPQGAARMRVICSLLLVRARCVDPACWKYAWPPRWHCSEMRLIIWSVPDSTFSLYSFLRKKIKRIKSLVNNSARVCVSVLVCIFMYVPSF
jgi:hypothetical protein